MSAMTASMRRVLNNLMTTNSTMRNAWLSNPKLAPLVDTPVATSAQQVAASAQQAAGGAAAAPPVQQAASEVAAAQPAQRAASPGPVGTLGADSQQKSSRRRGRTATLLTGVGDSVERFGG